MTTCADHLYRVDPWLTLWTRKDPRRCMQSDFVAPWHFLVDGWTLAGLLVGGSSPWLSHAYVHIVLYHKLVAAGIGGAHASVRW